MSKYPPVEICVWYCLDCRAYHWDDSEDHGGFDRISPMGPFASEDAALSDARNLFSNVSAEIVSRDEPFHYRDTDHPEHLAS